MNGLKYRNQNNKNKIIKLRNTNTSIQDIDIK